VEISGVNRLIAFAQELGVREAKSVARPERATREAVDQLPPRSTKPDTDDGFKVSLSPAANRLANGLATAEPPPASPDQSTSSLAQPRVDATPSSLRHDRAVAAYQKNSSAISGERIRVIA
jgi:hypothetical protein